MNLTTGTSGCVQKISRVNSPLKSFISLFFFLVVYCNSKACSPLNVPTMVGSPTVTATQLLIKWQSTTPYFCPDVIVVEIACNSAAYTGLAQYSFTSSVVTGASNPYTYPTMTINISQLCPGTLYKFRAKEKNNASTTSSAWSGNFTFTTPGTFVQPTLSLTASPGSVCPPQTSQLTANLINGCGGAGITYSWSPAGSLSCITCSNPVASPLVATTYTCRATGGQWGCWTASATVNVGVSTVPPTAGTISANPASLCAGQSTTLSSTSYTGNLQWQSSASSTGPFTNIAGATTATYVTGALAAGTIYYQAAVAGCGATLTTNQVAVTVNPSPTLTVNSPSMCAGQSVNLTVNGASTYTWSAGANSTGANTASASPAATTVYTVSGSAAGCTSSKPFTVTVVPNPIVNIASNSPVCQGFNLNLTSTGGGTYQWSGPNSFASAAQNPTIVGTTTAAAGVYNLTVTTSGCSTSANITVSVVNPTVSASNTGPYCAGNTVQLNASSAVSYTWTGPNGFTSSLQNPVIANSTTLASGNYTVKVTLGTCTAIATTSVTVNPNPTITVASTSICAGNIATLTANGGASYTWPAGINSTGVNTATTSPGTTTSYTVIGTAANSCTAPAAFNVTVYPYPVVNIGANSPVCLGFNLNLTSTGGGTYSWQGPNAFTSNAQNPTIVGTTTNAAGVYNLTVTANACSTTTNVSVVVVTPTVSASNTGPYCAGATVQLNGSSANSYTWTGPSSFSSNQQSPVISNSTPAATGIYTLLVSINTCTAQTTTSVTVNALPVPVLLSNSPVCEADVLTLLGAGGTNYAWSGPAGFTSSAQNPSITNVPVSASGVYTLTVTDANSCSQTTTALVIVKPLPVVAISGATVCVGLTATLNASGAAAYSWTGPNGFTSTAASPTIAVNSVSVAGTYNLLVTGANGCTLTTATTLGAFTIPNVTAWNSGPVCLGAPVTFTSSGGYVYQWTGPNGFISPNQNTSLASANSLAYSGTYTLAVMDNQGCRGFATTDLLVRDLPVASITASKKDGCVPFCSTFNVSSNSSITDVVWTSNTGASFHGMTYPACFTVDGNYKITSIFTDNFGCKNTNTFVVNVYPIPVADFNYGPGKPLEENEVDFTDASIGPAINNWKWFFINNDGFTSTLQNPAYTFSVAGAYPVTLIVSNKWGCKDTVTKAIVISEDFNIFIPNAFTPNGDGLNDVFQPKGHGLVKFSIRVFDRWGEELFYSKELTNGWDGTFKGKPCPSDVYSYKIIVFDLNGKAKQYIGHVTLLK